DPPVIDPGHSMRQWEKWLDTAHLRLAQQEWNIHRDTSSVPPLTQPSLLHASNLTGPEPSLQAHGAALRPWPETR
ncbi:hypothetical protein OSJ57_26850, partial [Sphingomonas sp. HH69]